MLNGETAKAYWDWKHCETMEKMQAEFYIALVRIQPKPSGLGYLNTYRQLKSLGSCP